MAGSGPSSGPVQRINAAISEVVSTFGLASLGITGPVRLLRDVEDTCGCSTSG